MKAIFAGVAMMVGALFLGPPTLQAQAPVVLVCQDGTTQPGSSKVACADHQGMDWDATKAWTEMRSGHFAESDSLVCKDGQRQAAMRNACRRHGGVDSVSTMAAVQRRARAERYNRQGGSEASADSTRNDSTKWGYPVNRNPKEQNPPGYRGMERPAGLNGERGDSAQADSGAMSRSDSSATTRSYGGSTAPADSSAGTRDSSRAGRSNGAATSDSSDVVHRQRSVSPGTDAPPPPYTPDSQKVWVQQRPQADSAGVPDSGIRADSGR